MVQLSIAQSPNDYNRDMPPPTGLEAKLRVLLSLSGGAEGLLGYFSAARLSQAPAAPLTKGCSPSA